jgi:hypothetical protein
MSEERTKEYMEYAKKMLTPENLPTSYLHHYYQDVYASSVILSGEKRTFEEFMKSEYPDVPIKDGRV